MSLRALMATAADGTVPDRAVAVTFDDGYADNVEHAWPLLERHGVAATVFLTTAYLDGAREFWWDDLERQLLLPGELPRRLRLRIGGAAQEWDLESATVYDEEDYRRHADWHVGMTHDPTPRHRVYRRLCARLRSVSHEDREATLRELSSVRVPGSPDAGGPRPTHRVLSRGEVARLAAGDLVEVGAHTETHPALSALPLAAQAAEIAGSKAQIERMTGRAATAFAYPFGGRNDYTPATVRLVRDAGFESACSVHPGVVEPGSDPFQVPRVLVRDWDPPTFARRLREWL
jgi:peptidoglycan/xylan/chitin deacetylase (PgdA/CDA1 family)